MPALQHPPHGKRPPLPIHLSHGGQRQSLNSPLNLMAPSHSSASLHSPRFQNKDTFRYPITDEGVKEMRVVRTFKDNTDKINHLHYSTDGRFMVTSSNDDSILVYDCGKGIKVQTVNSKKYGACFVQFLHTRGDSSYSVVHASSKVDNTLKYLRTDNKQYIRYYCGHSREVTAVSAASTEGIFLSCSADHTLRLWDLNMSLPTAILQLENTPVAAFDREAITFGVGVNGQIKLFDLRHFQKGPFWSTKLPNALDFSYLQFSPNNKQMLLSTFGSEMYVVDAFSGEVVHTLKGFKNYDKKPICLRPTFAPGSRYIFGGSVDGTVNCWSAKSGELLRRFPAVHPGPIENIGFHPKYYTLASTCSEMRWWIPTFEDFVEKQPRERRDSEAGQHGNPYGHKQSVVGSTPHHGLGSAHAANTNPNHPSNHPLARHNLPGQMDNPPEKHAPLSHEKAPSFDRFRDDKHPTHEKVEPKVHEHKRILPPSLDTLPPWDKHSVQKPQPSPTGVLPHPPVPPKDVSMPKEIKETITLDQSSSSLSSHSFGITTPDVKSGNSASQKDREDSYDPLNEILKGMNRELGPIALQGATTSANSSATTPGTLAVPSLGPTSNPATTPRSDKEKEREHRDRDHRDRERERERDRDRERDRERDRDHRERDRDRDKERDRDREHRERDHREHHRDRDRRDQRSKEKERDREHRS